MRGDRGHPGFRDQVDSGHPRVDVRHGRRPRVEAAGAPMRAVALDLHVEDVLVREPAGLRRQELGHEPGPARHEREPGGGEQVLDGAADDDVARGRRVERDRSDSLVAVHEHERAVLAGERVDRLDVVDGAGAVGDERRADERRALVDRRRVRVGLGRHLDDLGAPELLGVRDLADGGELVLRDDDPVALAREVECGEERADGGRDGGLDRDVVGLRAQEPGERGSRGLGPLDPVLPFGAVLVPAGEVLLVGRAHLVRERPLRARVDVDLALEDGKTPANGLADEPRACVRLCHHVCDRTCDRVLRRGVPNGQGRPSGDPRPRSARSPCPRGRRGPWRGRSRDPRSRAPCSRSARRRAWRRRPRAPAG